MSNNIFMLCHYCDNNIPKVNITYNGESNLLLASNFKYATCKIERNELETSDAITNGKRVMPILESKRELKIMGKLEI